MSSWRHAKAILLLPGAAVVAVPGIILAVGRESPPGWGLSGVVAALAVLIGTALVVGGVTLIALTVRLFARVGRGTLAPWDPPRRLVVEGPYRRMRNPMITGVLAVLIGEATIFGSVAIFIWGATFFAVNWIYFALHEEPGLERRFGGEYRAYRRNVPRWIPRRKPWKPGDDPSGCLSGQPSLARRR